MAALVIVAMAILAAVIIGLPLYKAREYEPWEEVAAPASGEGEAEPELKDLVAERDATYRAIKEIEFDFQVGNLSETDFADLRERYKARALSLIRAIRELEQAYNREATDSQVPVVETSSSPQSTASVDDLIERAVAARRRLAKADATCPTCGQAHDRDARFCSHCGRQLNALCPACGKPYEPGENFCAYCGAPLRLSPEATATLR